jgi:ElaA protein
MPPITWVVKPFEQLTNYELYEMLRLRAEVFIVEQNCPYLDLDRKDYQALHLMGWQGDSLVACTRLLSAGISFTEASIGRVVSSPAVRGQGIGIDLMKTSIEKLYQLFGQVPIRIGAQLYLKKFYESHGFQQVSEVYLEDDIEHIEMLKQPQP